MSTGKAGFPMWVVWWLAVLMSGPDIRPIQFHGPGFSTEAECQDYADTHAYSMEFYVKGALAMPVDAELKLISICSQGRPV
jgi:hypothetical protein